MWKLIDVKPKKWNAFHKWCVAKDTTIKAEINEFLKGGPELWKQLLKD